MKVAGLFAGIGGLEVGLARAGHRAEFLCEIWEPAQAVLRSHLPSVSIYSDIRELSSLPGDTELLVGGFPCQDLSQAGSTAGIEGARSGLVAEVFRLIDKRRVPWVMLENVPFMLQLNRGHAMKVLIEAFEERGYRWAYRVVSSLSFLPQRRERVIFLATTADQDPASVLLVDEETPSIPETDLDVRAHGFYWTEGLRGLGWAVDAVPTLKNGSTLGIASPPAIIFPSGDVVTPDIRDAERLQGFAEDWTLQAEMVAKPSIRWSLVGNAVTVPVAEWLGSRLTRPGDYELGRDLDLGNAWPKAARFDGSRRHAVSINAFPKWTPRPPLAEFLRHSGKLLSARATRGFISRAERAKLRFPESFLSRLRAHLERMERSPTTTEVGRVTVGA